MRGLLRDERTFSQPILGLNSPFRDLFGKPADCLLGSLFGGLRGLFDSLSSPFGGLFGRRPPPHHGFWRLTGGLLNASLSGRRFFRGLASHSPDRVQNTADLAGDLFD